MGFHYSAHRLGAMKSAAISLVLMATVMVCGCSPSPRTAQISLGPVPYDMEVPAELAPRLTTGPITGTFAKEVVAAGALASVTVFYQPQSGEKMLFFTAYSFPSETFDALQSPDEPPVFGTEVDRSEGRVLSVAGPQEAIFAPDTPEGRNLAALEGMLYLPSTYTRR